MATVIINDTTPRVKYTANGSTTRFDFDFVCFQTADLVVYVGDTVAETGFTITHDPTTLKGYVTFATAPAAGTGITLVRRMAYDQKVDFTQVALLKRDPLHNEFSRVFAMIQQINEAIGRSVTVDVFSDATPAELTGMIEDLWAIKDDMTTDAANISAITTTAGSIANVNAVAGNATNINAVAGDQTNIDAVAGDLTNIDAAVANETNINAVVANETNINAAVANETNINAAVANATNINAAVANETNINAVAGDQTNIDAVAGDLTNIDAVAGDLTNIDAAATNISDINTTAANIAAIIDALNQAIAAAASATLAQKWASKTDGPVEGSEYSAKWYALNTDASGKADKDLSNLSATGEAHFADPSLSNLTNGLANTICTTTPSTIGTASSSKPAVVVQNYKNGAFFYRKWSDGFIEQGGVAAASYTSNVSFFVAFSSTNYVVEVTGVDSTSTGYIYSAYNRTTTGMTIYTAPGGATASCAKSWYACGY